VSTLLGDYNRLLALSIWLFFASGLLMFKSPGHGVAYLGPGEMRLRFPSWRAAFGRRLALLVNPIQSLWPMADVQLFAPSREGAMNDLVVSAHQLARSMRRARPFLLVATGIVVIVIPVWVLTRGADLIFIALAGVGYALYAAAVGVLLGSGKRADRHRIGEHWKTLLEPLLCLPYGAHLCRKLSERYGLSVPLVDILRSQAPLSFADLQDLMSHIRELRSTSNDVQELAFIMELQAIVETRLAGHSQ
jgi:hypothetical protein